MAVIRQPDSLGRVVLPKEMRRALGIESGSGVEIFVEGRTIILKRYKPRCIFCDAETGSTWRTRPVCDSCLTELRGMLEASTTR